MRVHGEFTVESGGAVFTVPNTLVSEGLEKLLAANFQAAALSNFYLGLCDQVGNFTDTLASITTEPSATNGYARALLARNTTDWPTVSTANNETSVLSKSVTFTASGGDFSSQFSRLFLCDVSSGAAGTLFSFSAALASPILITNGNSVTVTYRLYLK